MTRILVSLTLLFMDLWLEAHSGTQNNYPASHFSCSALNLKGPAIPSHCFAQINKEAWGKKVPGENSI